MPFIDFDKVREMITLGEVLELVGGLVLSVDWDAQRGPCPLGCHPDPKCCGYNKRVGYFYCHRCKVGGEAFDLYRKISGKEYFQAAIDLCKALGKRVPYRPRSKERKQRPPRKRGKKVSGTGNKEVDSGG